jgi:hypothetical protein
MNQNAQDPVQAICSRLHPALPGLFFALLTLLFGFGLGIVFGANEDAIKSRLAASAAEVSETVYQGDEEQMTAVLGKSWTYMKRAHLHAGSLGGIAVALTLLIVLLNTPSAWTRVISLFSGFGPVSAPPLSAARQPRKKASNGWPYPRPARWSSPPPRSPFWWFWP